MRIEENSIIQSLENENTDIKQGAVIYLLTESFSVLHHIYEMNGEDKECRMLKEDLAELFISTKEYCNKYGISWDDCKDKIMETNNCDEFITFIRLLKL